MLKLLILLFAAATTPCRVSAVQFFEDSNSFEKISTRMLADLSNTYPVVPAALIKCGTSPSDTYRAVCAAGSEADASSPVWVREVEGRPPVQNGVKADIPTSGSTASHVIIAEDPTASPNFNINVAYRNGNQDVAVRHVSKTSSTLPMTLQQLFTATVAGGVPKDVTNVFNVLPDKPGLAVAYVPSSGQGVHVDVFFANGTHHQHDLVEVGVNVTLAKFKRESMIMPMLDDWYWMMFTVGKTPEQALTRDWTVSAYKIVKVTGLLVLVETWTETMNIVDVGALEVANYGGFDGTDSKLTIAGTCADSSTAACIHTTRFYFSGSPSSVFTRHSGYTEHVKEMGNPVTVRAARNGNDGRIFVVGNDGGRPFVWSHVMQDRDFDFRGRQNDAFIDWELRLDGDDSVAYDISIDSVWEGGRVYEVFYYVLTGSEGQNRVAVVALEMHSKSEPTWLFYTVVSIGFLCCCCGCVAGVRRWRHRRRTQKLEQKQPSAAPVGTNWQPTPAPYNSNNQWQQQQQQQQQPKQQQQQSQVKVELI